MQSHAMVPLPFFPPLPTRQEEKICQNLPLLADEIEITVSGLDLIPVKKIAMATRQQFAAMSHNADQKACWQARVSTTSLPPLEGELTLMHI